MRRGLMAWDAEQIPLAALHARIEGVQAAIAAEGQDAILLYTNFIRSAAVSYITAFSPYWADGILMVPRVGAPVFATTLSNRVASWVESVKPIGELVHSPKPGVTLAERLKADPATRKVAILELDHFPGGVYDEFADALPGVAIVDGTASFAAARGRLDAVERALLRRTDAMAAAALSAIDPDMVTAGAVTGAVEQHARAAGAEEVYVALAPDLATDTRFRRANGTLPLGKTFAVRATVAYKGSWTRRTLTFPRQDRAEQWFDALATDFHPDRPALRQLQASLALLPGATLESCLAETVVGTRPLAPLAEDATAAAVVVTVRLAVDGRPWCGARLMGPGEG